MWASSFALALAIKSVNRDTDVPQIILFIRQISLTQKTRLHSSPTSAVYRFQQTEYRAAWHTQGSIPQAWKPENDVLSLPQLLTTV